MDGVQSQLEKFLHDERYLSARISSRLSKALGIKRDVLAKLSIGVYFLLLTFSSQAVYLANLPLLLYPLLVAILYEKEAASPSQMLIYWPLFAALTSLDSLLERFYLYYPVKVLALSAIVVHLTGWESLLRAIKETIRQAVLEPEELSLLAKKTRGSSSSGGSSSEWSTEWTELAYPYERTLAEEMGVESEFMQTPRDRTVSTFTSVKSTVA